MTEAVQEFEFDPQLNSIFESAGIGMGVSNQVGRWVRVNDAFATMLGFTPDELLQKSFIEITHPDDRAFDVGIREKMLADEFKIYQREKRYIHKNGDLVWVLLHVSILKDAGKPAYFFTQIQNVTPRKEAERALCDSKENFQMLAEVMPHLVWVTRSDGSALYVNKQWEEYTGVPIDYTGTSWTACFHPEDRLATTQAWSRALANGGNYSVEVRLRKADGVYHWWLVRGSALRDEAGNILKWYGTCTNIDAIRNALDEAKNSASLIAELSELINQARDVIVLRNVDGEIHVWSRGAEKLFGWSAVEAIGQKDTDLYVADAKAHQESVMALLKDGFWDGEKLLRTRDGTMLTIESCCTLMRDTKGRPKSILEIGVDVTEQRKNLEATLRSQRLESIGTLAGGIAHDLNNILTPIMMGTELLIVSETERDRLSTLNTLADCSKRGADMVRQLLTFAKGAEGERVELKADVILGDIERIIDETFLKSIEVSCTITPQLWSVMGDSTQLHQVLLNLVINARDSMPNGGMLHLRAENIIFGEYEARNEGIKPGCYVRLSVEDDGVGMPKSVLERIFVPFFTTKEFGTGTGLGLPTSKSIVKSHGGYLHVYSIEGVGTKFTVYLPALHADLANHHIARTQVQTRGVA